MKGTCIAANFESNGPLVLVFITYMYKSGWGFSIPVIPEVKISDFISFYKILAKSFCI